MENLVVLEYSLHKININELAPVPLALDSNTNDLKDYAGRVLTELLESPRSRNFKFKNMAELVPSSLLAVINGEPWANKSSGIAQKLYDVEIQVQDRIKQLNKEIRRGCLLQLKVKHDDVDKFVLIKIDDDEFFDETDLKIKIGLPASKIRIQKAAVATFATDNTVAELILSDTKPTITEYWYLSFLIAEQLKDSETNTKNAFNAIERLLNKDVKSVSPVDYWFLRNDIVNHFRNEKSLAFDDLVTKVKSHNPETEAFKGRFEAFVQKFEDLPTKASKPFDTQFDLEPSVIKARIVRKVMLDNNFELRINGEVKDLRNKIFAESDNKGKFIKIYSDKGYDEFSTFRGN